MRLAALVALCACALALTGCGEAGEAAAPTAATTASGPPPAVDGPARGFLDGGFPPYETPTPGGVAIAALDADVDCWTGQSGEPAAWSLMAFARRGLYGRPDAIARPATWLVRPELAADMPRLSEDGLVLEVRLRDGLAFDGGAPVTAEAVKASFERMLDPTAQCASAGPLASGFYAAIRGVDDYAERRRAGEEGGIDGIRVVDGLTIAFELERPDPDLPQALALPWAFVRDVAGAGPGPAPPPGVGPYRFAHVGPFAVRLERDPGWTANVEAGVPTGPGDNQLDGLIVRIGVAPEDQEAGLRAGALDLSLDAAAPRGPQVAAAAADPALAERLFSTPSEAVLLLAPRADRAPFLRLEARRALVHAVDRAAYARILGGALAARPWARLLPAALLAGEARGVERPDPVRARALVRAAGLGGAERRVVVLHPAEAPGPALAAQLGRDLREIGLVAEPRGLPAGAYQRALYDPASEHDLALVWAAPAYPSATSLLGPLLRCGSAANPAGFCDPAFDRALADAAQLPLGPERDAQLARLAVQLGDEQAPLVPLVAPRRLSLVSARLGDYRWGPAKGPYLGLVFLRDAAEAG